MGFPSAADLARLLLAAVPVEVARRSLGPAVVLRAARYLGKRARLRNEAERRRLRRGIGWVDRCWPGAPNCYRRALLETVLDRGAAGERLHMGLRRSGAPRSGHVWLDVEGTPAEAYDFEVTV